MRVAYLTAVKAGITRLRDKGGASEDALYDLVNGYVTAARTIRMRQAARIHLDLPPGTIGLTSFKGAFVVYADQVMPAGPGYSVVVLKHPSNAAATLKEIHFSLPFLGYLYVVAEFSDGSVYHFWLEEGKPWSPNTTYLPDALVSPTTPNGLAYRLVDDTSGFTSWEPYATRAVGNVIVPTVSNGFRYIVTDISETGARSGESEPTWPTQVGGTVHEDVPIENPYSNPGSGTSSASIPVWSSGTLFSPGDIVRPTAWPSPTPTAPTNGNFSAGATGWDYEGGAAFATTGGMTDNGNCVQMPGSVSDGAAVNQARFVVADGASLTASCFINQGSAANGATRGWCEIRWYDVNGLMLSYTQGNMITTGNTYQQSTVTSSKPDGAAYARAVIGLWSVADHNHVVYGDNLTVSGAVSGLPAGFMFRATQAAPGHTANTEPAWPNLLGATVVDGGVTWEAVAMTRVTWQAIALYISGATEPVWPTVIGSTVVDGTVTWQAISRRIEDENCPNSKVVAIAASKVFAADGDTVRYSATAAPKDWSSADDAGFLPTGLQNYGANPVAAMGLYRGNLIPFNAEAFQLWQVDEDPASMALLDALPMGSTQHRAIAAVSNDLLFLSSQGVRTVGIAASSTNFQAGDVGMPIDVLVQAWLAQPEVVPRALYYPAAGQYWLMFAKDGQTEVFVYTMTQIGQVGAWSRYLFPFEVHAWAIQGDSLYLRSANRIYRMDEGAVGDELSAGVFTPFQGVIQWPWLDFGQPGVTKMMYGFEVVGRGRVQIQIGYNQTNGGDFTPAYEIDPDTLTGGPIPMSVAAPTFAVRLVYDGTEAWQWNAFGLYLQDMRPMS
ncbi:hypothetical protein [[Pseudomonas] boreopolis]|uniref:Uncharacterized protein n=1 Tax=Xanthomonas boreopolis TaxID=86183 RepID=A0A919F984_9XANT|nr:hypothetical protein GCM10009090_25200 [[Pseudomonas] boreopolis]